jgi:hypothetical protein
MKMIKYMGQLPVSVRPDCCLETNEGTRATEFARLKVQGRATRLFR